MSSDFDEARRRLLVTGGAGLGGTLLSSSLTRGALAAGAPVDEGITAANHVSFPPIQSSTERAGSGPPNPDAPAGRVGFAVMGLGRLALENVLPAFAECRHARPVALVSGDAAKMRAIARQYGIAASACYSYAEFERIRQNPNVQAVYVILPNALHRDAVVRAARAGKHVLCEKPMATTVDEARDMVDACQRARVRLMIAYRCQYEVYNRELAKRARGGAFGAVQLIDAINTQNQGDPGQWRQKIALAGGGSLPDVGLYCLNTTRALLGEEPAEVSAYVYSPKDDARFAEVESTVSFTLRFPSGVVANCASSYSAHEHRNLRVVGASGTGEIQNAFAYQGQRLRILKKDGEADSDSQLTLNNRNQFSLEIDHLAMCIRDDVQPRTPGEEGLQDQLIMAAIYQSARTGKPVQLEPVTTVDRFRGPALS